MDIDKLQQSHREAVLRNIATGEFNPLEHRDTMDEYLGGSPVAAAVTPPPPASSSADLVPGQYTCSVKAEGKRALGDYRRIS